MLKVIVIVFISFAISRVILRFRDKLISFRELIFWIIVWSLGGLLMLIPNLSDIFAKTIGIGRGADAVFFLTIVFLFYLHFRLYVKTEKIDKKITDLAINISKSIHKQKNKN